MTVRLRMAEVTSSSLVGSTFFRRNAGKGAEEIGLAKRSASPAHSTTLRHGASSTECLYVKLPCPSVSTSCSKVRFRRHLLYPVARALNLAENRPRRASHRFRRLGSSTSSCPTGHSMPTARRPSRCALRHSSSVAISATISPVPAVRGPETALNPPRWDPSSVRSSTLCPGSGTSGVSFFPNSIGTIRTRALESGSQTSSLAPSPGTYLRL
jgi:hypothetical protein